MSDASRYSRFNSLFEDAIRKYETQTGIQLVNHPFSIELNSCTTVESITTMVLSQAKAFRDYRGEDGKVMRCLKGAVHMLHTLSTSGVLGQSIGLVPFPPANALFTGLGILLSGIKEVGASYDALGNLLESIENFLKRLDIYTKLSSMTALDEIIVKIMVELLSTLALVTKEIEGGRLKKFGKKLFGENDIEDALQRLDRLTYDEARTTAAQTLEVVYGLAEKMKTYVEDGNLNASTKNIQKALAILQGVANKMNGQERYELRSWLSPPDPWKNYDLARSALHKGTAAWFTQGDAFASWKSSHSLLWIHGKPGSGKSVLSSAIIQDLEKTSELGLASTAFYFFDFRDGEKQTRRGLLSSLLVQLCDQSGDCYEILWDLFSTLRKGSRSPSDDELMRCLKKMVTSQRQAPIHIVIDALDECPNTFGILSARKGVLSALQELLELRRQNLRICITSRPEPDITKILTPLAPQCISLHDQPGQRRDIVNYITFIVGNDPAMERWRPEDKKLVIDTLSEKADGMFRWISCQLDFLRNSFPQRIKRALKELPVTLDETYENTLRRIPQAKWDYAKRLFQCITVASRSLRVEEVAEFLAFDFKDGSIPDYNTKWRPIDPIEAVLSTCSSLLAVVDRDGSKVIQFSHYSVKEFLVSDRIADADKIISRYHVLMEPAHTTILQVCLVILLNLSCGPNERAIKDIPLSRYAAQHWVDHARFGKDSARTKDLTKQIFDPREPHFLVWTRIHDVLSDISFWASEDKLQRVLHYAAVCGLPDVVEFLVTECSQVVNPPSNQTLPTPLYLAAQAGHDDVIEMLLCHDANVNAKGDGGRTALHAASAKGHLRAAQVLLNHHPDTDAQDVYGKTPLHYTLENGHLNIALSLIKHIGNKNICDNLNTTPLHLASENGYLEVVLALLKHGADANVRNGQQKSPLHRALENRRLEVVRALLKHGVDPNTRYVDDTTLLHRASVKGYLEAVLLLLEYRADSNAHDKYKMAPLHRASHWGHLSVVRALLEHGATPNIRDAGNRTPLHGASEMGYQDVILTLLEYNADANALDDEKKAPLHCAAENRRFLGVRALLERGADPNIRDSSNRTPLHLASVDGPLKTVELLLNHAVNVNARDNNDYTPLHLAYKNRRTDIADALLAHGAHASAQENDNWTKLQWISKRGR